MKVSGHLEDWKPVIEEVTDNLQEKLGRFEVPDFRLLTFDDYVDLSVNAAISAYTLVNGEDSLHGRNFGEFLEIARYFAAKEFIEEKESCFLDHVNNVVYLSGNLFLRKPHLESFLFSLRKSIIAHESVHAFTVQNVPDFYYPLHESASDHILVYLDIEKDMDKKLPLMIIDEGISTFVSGGPVILDKDIEGSCEILERWLEDGGKMPQLEPYALGFHYVRWREGELKGHIPHLGERMLYIARTAPRTLDGFKF